jgi:hypothetical protein
MMEGEIADRDVLETDYTYQADSDQSLSEAVLHAVAMFTGRKMVATSATEQQEVLDPLHGTIDPDALDGLFQTSNDRASLQGIVEFRYCGCEVTVDSTGKVRVRTT